MGVSGFSSCRTLLISVFGEALGRWLLSPLASLLRWVALLSSGSLLLVGAWYSVAQAADIVTTRARFKITPAIATARTAGEWPTSRLENCSTTLTMPGSLSAWVAEYGGMLERWRI